MSVVHKTIMDVRSLFNGLDESVLPGLIDGEKRNVAKYDDALKTAGTTANVASLLTAAARQDRAKDRINGNAKGPRSRARNLLAM